MSQLTVLNNIDLLPPDALFDIKQRYSNDTRANKVDLGIGAYRDNNGRPWVLPSVKHAEQELQADPSFNHEYLPITGLPEFTSGAAKIIFDEQYDPKSTVSVQSISGTGALHIAAKFVSKFLPNRSVFVSDPTWANHAAIFNSQDVDTKTYPYWDAATKSLNLNGFIESIDSAPTGSIFLLHACAHNPTGLDPTEEQWAQILNHIASKNHIALFDSAYQGFASGNLGNDAFSVRLGLQKLRKVSPILVCQSFAKNFGLYGERAGCFHLVLPEQDDSKLNDKVFSAVKSQLANIVRSEVSNPPAYGAKIVAKILNNDTLKDEWYQDMITMSSRINIMRHKLRDHLVQLETPGNWDHVVNQCGMFSFTGLTKKMVHRLETQHGIYMVASGRASMAGLNENNVEYVARAIDETVRFFQNEIKL